MELLDRVVECVVLQLEREVASIGSHRHGKNANAPKASSLSFANYIFKFVKRKKSDRLFQSRKAYFPTYEKNTNKKKLKGF